MLLLAEYKIRCENVSDINEHLPVLYEYTQKCSSVVECGVRSIVSSYAFALGLKDTPNNMLTMVDPQFCCDMPQFLSLCESEKVNAQFFHQSDLDCPIVKTDLLFIDTWHVYGQLKRELERWHSSVYKYIIMHDTTVDEWEGETVRMEWDAQRQSEDFGIPIDEINKGLWPAIEEFLENHKDWAIDIRLINNNGLTILKRL